MKIKTTFAMALAIAVTTGLAAQESSQTQANSAGVPVVCQAEHWTNGVRVLAPANPTFYDERLNIPPEKPGLVVERVDPVILLFTDSKQSITADGETKQVSIRVPESAPSVFGSFFGNEILFWTQETVHTNRGTRTGNEVQIIVLEPEDDIADSIRTLEYSDLAQETPAWYEWVNPSFFLAKWTDYWLHGTRATPVVLVSFSF